MNNISIFCYLSHFFQLKWGHPIFQLNFFLPSSVQFISKIMVNYPINCRYNMAYFFLTHTTYDEWISLISASTIYSPPIAICTVDPKSNDFLQRSFFFTTPIQSFAYKIYGIEESKPVLLCLSHPSSHHRTIPATTSSSRFLERGVRIKTGLGRTCVCVRVKATRRNEMPASVKNVYEIGLLDVDHVQTSFLDLVSFHISNFKRVDVVFRILFPPYAIFL